MATRGPKNSKRGRDREFPGGPVVRILRFHPGSIPDWGNKIPQATRCGPKKKKKKKEAGTGFNLGHGTLPHLWAPAFPECVALESVRR